VSLKMLFFFERPFSSLFQILYYYFLCFCCCYSMADEASESGATARISAFAAYFLLL
jgi:hypothetical protein